MNTLHGQKYADTSLTIASARRSSNRLVQQQIQLTKTHQVVVSGQLCYSLYPSVHTYGLKSDDTVIKSLTDIWLGFQVHKLVIKRGLHRNIMTSHRSGSEPGDHFWPPVCSQPSSTTRVPFEAYARPSPRNWYLVQTVVFLPETWKLMEPTPNVHWNRAFNCKAWYWWVLLHPPEANISCGNSGGRCLVPEPLLCGDLRPNILYLVHTFPSHILT